MFDIHMTGKSPHLPACEQVASGIVPLQSGDISETEHRRFRRAVWMCGLICLLLIDIVVRVFA